MFKNMDVGAVALGSLTFGICGGCALPFPWISVPSYVGMVVVGVLAYAGWAEQSRED